MSGGELAVNADVLLTPIQTHGELAQQQSEQQRRGRGSVQPASAAVAAATIQVVAPDAVARRKPKKPKRSAKAKQRRKAAAAAAAAANAGPSLTNRVKRVKRKKKPVTRGVEEPYHYRLEVASLVREGERTDEAASDGGVAAVAVGALTGEADSVAARKAAKRRKKKAAAAAAAAAAEEEERERERERQRRKQREQPERDGALLDDFAGAGRKARERRTGGSVKERREGVDGGDGAASHTEHSGVEEARPAHGRIAGSGRAAAAAAAAAEAERNESAFLEVVKEYGDGGDIEALGGGVGVGVGGSGGDDGDLLGDIQDELDNPFLQYLAKQEGAPDVRTYVRDVERGDRTQQSKKDGGGARVQRSASERGPRRQQGRQPGRSASYRGGDINKYNDDRSRKDAERRERARKERERRAYEDERRRQEKQQSQRLRRDGDNITNDGNDDGIELQEQPRAQPAAPTSLYRPYTGPSKRQFGEPRLDALVPDEEIAEQLAALQAQNADLERRQQQEQRDIEAAERAQDVERLEAIQRLQRHQLHPAPRINPTIQRHFSTAIVENKTDIRRSLVQLQRGAQYAEKAGYVRPVQIERPQRAHLRRIHTVGALPVHEAEEDLFARIVTHDAGSGAPLKAPTRRKRKKKGRDKRQRGANSVSSASSLSSRTSGTGTSASVSSVGSLSSRGSAKSGKSSKSSRSVGRTGGGGGTAAADDGTLTTANDLRKKKKRAHRRAEKRLARENRRLREENARLQQQQQAGGGSGAAHTQAQAHDRAERLQAGREPSGHRQNTRIVKAYNGRISKK